MGKVLFNWDDNKPINGSLSAFFARIAKLSFCATLVVSIFGCSSLTRPGATTSNLNLDPKKDPNPGFLISKDAFVKSTAIKTMVVKPSVSAQSTPFIPLVLLYTSESTKTYLETGGVNAVYRIQVWENLLKKYNIPFKIIAKPHQIDPSDGGVLLLPSSIALSNQERQAIVNFRARGGSVLVTWAAGIRDEQGAWTGFDFMDQVLDTKVVGSTAADKDDTFLMTQGDSPVNQALPAGQRIWTERAREWYPLRIEATAPSLHIMDWSRTFHNGRQTAVGHFTERRYDSVNHSRVVALGIPERLWLTADPRHLEAIAHNSLHWLMRVPSASKSAWPKQYESALLFAMDCAETLLDPDIVFLEKLEEAGVRATLYILGDNAQKSADKIKALLQRGHELALAGDKFTGFEGQTSQVQAARIDSALEKINRAGLRLPDYPSFHAPAESYDKTTETLIRARGFTSYIAFQDANETRLPMVHSKATGVAKGERALLALVRTQRGPEDATEEGDVEEGLKSFYAELALSIQMRGLNVIRLPSQGLLTTENLQDIANEFKKHRAKIWTTTASELTQWWAERERLSVNIDGELTAPYLNLEVIGTSPLKQKISVLINLPQPNSNLSLVSSGKIISDIKITKLDNFRANIELPELEQGKYRWLLDFSSQAVNK